jgi:cation diffusion facilitator CzcD-associated flavoprotein CzcO
MSIHVIEHFDIVIVGAGISGIGMAYYLKQRCPDKSFVVLDGLKSFGGTWTTHRYPGIRSDSDLNTYGYSFKPWTGPPTATAAEILNYMGEVIEENELTQHIRYQHHLESAKWSSKDHIWTIEGVCKDTGESIRLSCNFLSMCQGYYRHSEGYTPAWEGMDGFAGQIVHPQHWPADLDHQDKEVLVIGSGSTMSTLVPAIAYDVQHVTVLQRSPTFFFPIGDEDDLAELLRKLDIDETWIHEILRRQRIYNGHLFAKRAAEEPEAVREELIDAVRQRLPEGYDVEKHFTPRNRPWHQRIARDPNGDFIASISDGRTTMVTDEIERFTEQGVFLRSGRELQADIVVTATGFNLCVFGDIAFSVDDQPVDFAETITYRGTMFTGVPNMAWVFGYFRASWTLRVDLIGDFVCRLLQHMDQRGCKSVVPTLRPKERDMPLSPWVAPENFNPNYVRRSIHLLPKSGDTPEWQHTQDYWQDKDVFPTIDLDDPVFVYQ